MNKNVRIARPIELRRTVSIKEKKLTNAWFVTNHFKTKNAGKSFVEKFGKSTP
jgi:hypothetical protein